MRWPAGAAARDAVSAIIFLAVSIVGMALTVDFPARAATWPMWMWGLLAVFSLALLFGALRQRPDAPSEEEAFGEPED